MMQRATITLLSCLVIFVFTSETEGAVSDKFCHKRVPASQTFFHLSYWPQVWPSSLPATCDVTFNVNPAGRADNWTVVAKITDSYLLRAENGSCLDRLVIYDDQNTTYCGPNDADADTSPQLWRKMTWENVASDAQITLFTPGHHDDAQHTARVSFSFWKIKEPNIYKTTPEGSHLRGKTCNETFVVPGELNNDYHGNITYQDNQHCLMKIYTGVGQSTIIMKWREFKLEYCPNCTCDYIEFPDGSRFCGSSEQPAPQNSRAPELNYAYYYYASNDTFDILFHTDSTLNDYGFLLDFDIKSGVISSTPKPSVTSPSGACREETNETSGVLTSPGFPNPYPHPSSCSYVIDLQNKARNSKLVTVTFDQFEVGSVHACVKNGFIFLSGSSPHLCGRSTEQYRNISKNYVFQFVTRQPVFIMKLVTDGSELSEFSLRYNVSDVSAPETKCLPLKQNCTRICTSGFAKDWRGCRVSCQCRNAFETGCYCNKFGALQDPPRCIASTDHCLCRPGYVGAKCDQCDHEYYMDPKSSTCIRCPDQCSMNEFLSKSCYITDSMVTCEKCPVGYTGPQCTQCIRRYFRNYQGRCQECHCNDREIASATPYCRDNDGSCMSCLYHFTGRFCEKCKPSFTYNASSGECVPPATLPVSATTDTPVLKKSDESNPGLAIGITFLVLLIIGGVVIGVYIYKKRYKATPGFGHSRFGVNFNSNGQTLGPNYMNT